MREMDDFPSKQICTILSIMDSNLYIGHEWRYGNVWR
jgi:hypothetical protein